MTDPIRQYIDTHIPENHRQGDGCWDAAEKELNRSSNWDMGWSDGFTTGAKFNPARWAATLDARAPLDEALKVAREMGPFDHEELLSIIQQYRKETNPGRVMALWSRIQVDVIHAGVIYDAALAAEGSGE